MSGTLTIRVTPETRVLIDRATDSLGKNQAAFILDAAIQAAEEVLLERTVIGVTADAYAALLARLDQPAQPNERLKRTMRTPVPWDPSPMRSEPEA